MRDNSRSRSKSPTRSNDFKGDTRPSDPPCNKVYVTFLPEDVQQSKLKEIFEECGTVTRLFLKKKDDGFTFAHIHYQSVDEARNAIDKLNKRKIGSKNIKVQFGRQMNRGDSKDSRDGSRDKFGQDRSGPRGGEFRKDSDTRRRFDNQGGFEGRGRGGGRGRGNDRGNGQRGGFKEQGFRGGGDRGDRGGERGPMKCFKCQGQGHMSKNCPNAQGDQKRSGHDTKSFKPQKPIDKMSEDEFSDY